MRYYPTLLSLAKSFKTLAVIWGVLAMLGLLIYAFGGMQTDTPHLMALVGAAIAVAISTAVLWAFGELILVFVGIGEDLNAVRSANAVMEDRIAWLHKAMKKRMPEG